MPARGPDEESVEPGKQSEQFPTREERDQGDPIMGTVLAQAIFDCVEDAVEIKAQHRVSGWPWLETAVVKWTGETDARLAKSGAGQLREEWRSDGVWPPYEADDYIEYLDRQIYRFREALAKLRGEPISERAARKSEVAGPMVEEAQRVRVATERENRRLALAEETDQLSAELIGLHERWSNALLGDPEGVTDAAGRMLEEYHAKHRARTLALFDRLVQEGVMLNADHYRQFFARPEKPGIVGGLPDLLDEAAARLRLHDPALAAWLNERIPEFKSLAADLREQGQRPVPVLQRLNVIQNGYSNLTDEVAQRLRRDAKVWLDYWTENPPGYNSVVTRIRGEELLEEADELYEYATNQLAFLRDQVG